MSTDAAIDRVKSELNRAFDRTHADLERVEILAASLAAFNTPIPPYEPRFHHLQRFTLSAHELPSQRKLRARFHPFSGTNTGRKPLTDDG